jgi:energy-converting hydrogenase Eha subunit F
MVSILGLWLPIVLSAVFVFIVSSIVHMFLGHHRNDFKKLPNEDRLLQALHAENLSPGDYLFPRPASHKDMGSPEMLEKYKRGPIGVMTVLPSGPPTMGKQLSQWFLFCLAVGISVAYLTGRALGPGAEYLAVFRFAGTGAFYSHAFGRVVESIWMGRAWSTTVKNVFDGLLYALVTAGTFGWLWPR